MSTLKSGTDDDNSINVEEDWLNNVLCGFRALDEDIRTVIYDIDRSGANWENKYGLKFYKISLPSFDIRDYPKFRSDFDNYVLPKLNTKDVLYVL